MKSVCFWKIPNSTDQGATEEVQSHIVQGYNSTSEAKAVVAFLRQSQRMNFQKGIAVCRICKTSLGSSDAFHGKFLFPEKWGHYITHHSVKPWDQDLIEAATKCKKEPQKCQSSRFKDLSKSQQEDVNVK